MWYLSQIPLVPEILIVCIVTPKSACMFEQCVQLSLSSFPYPEGVGVVDLGHPSRWAGCWYGTGTVQVPECLYNNIEVYLYV